MRAVYIKAGKLRKIVPGEKKMTMEIRTKSCKGGIYLQYALVQARRPAQNAG